MNTSQNPFDLILARIDDIEAKIDGLRFIVPETDIIMNVEEAANFLNLSKSTLYKRVWQNTIPFMKQASRLFFSQRELEQWLKANRRLSITESNQIMDKIITGRR